MYPFGNELIAQARADEMARIARRDSTAVRAWVARRPGPLRRVSGRALVRIGRRLERGRPLPRRASTSPSAAIAGR